MLLAVLAAAAPCRADERAAEWLRRLRAAVAGQESSRVDFGVNTSDGYSDSGYYVTAEGGYYLSMGGVRVFCDGGVRYEVNDEGREVTVDRVDPSADNLLDDPVHAFDFVDGNYRAELVSEDAEEAVVRLTPRSEGGVDRIEVHVDARRGLPRRIVYVAQGLSVEIDVRRFEPQAGGLPRFERSQFDGYEVIDFR